MSEKSKKSGKKSKERGLNVRVVQEDKDKDDAKVRVNYHTDKKGTSKKTTKNKGSQVTVKKAKKKTAVKKTAAKKNTESKKTITVKNEAETKKVKVAKAENTETEIKIDKEVEEKPVEANAVEDSEAEKKEEKPASLSGNTETEAKPETEVKPETEAKPETEVKPETEAKPETEVKPETEDHFETLILNAETDKAESRIVLRDVEKTSKKVEEGPAEASAVEDSEAEKKEEKPTLAEVIIDTAKVSTREPKLSAREIKERAIKKAIGTATRLPDTKKRTRKLSKLGWARITLMVTCATTAVFSLVYFINVASSDMPLTVVAANSGIEASYPNYVPRGYELSDITSASGRITMNFKSEDGTFMLTEESSDWDSKALLNNYIKKNYADDDYATITENGLTIYMGANWEAWVNGGILYKLNVKTGSLTKKQLKTIATSL